MTGLDNQGEQSATGRGEPRPVATGLDTDYTLSIEEVAERYAHAGHPRTIRTLQRYCVSGHLDCRKADTTYGDKFLVAPYSVRRHIAQVNEMAMVATGRDASRPVATTVAAPAAPEAVKTSLDGGATGSDQPRPPTTGDDKAAQPNVRESEIENRYVAALERENGFLRDQIGRKDEQIGELSARARETNFLIKGLQDLFLGLQPGRPEAPKTRSASEGENGTPATH
jgi:hypothetical protein